MPLDKSVRQSVIEAIGAAFAAVRPPPAGQPPADGDWPLQFSSVNFGPLTDPDQAKRYTCGIVPGVGRERYEGPFIVVTLPVDIEFRMTVNRGDDKPALMAERLLTVVQRVMMNDRQWGGLALDTSILGEEVDMRTFLDKSIVGVLHTAVMFRHATADPRSPDGSFGEG